MMTLKIIERFKNLISKKTEGDNKKNIENLVVFLILLIIIIIAINSIWAGEKEVPEEESENVYRQLVHSEGETSTIYESQEYNLEKRLEEILSKITGVGKVRVMITYSATSQLVCLYNEQYNYKNTEESDSNGGSRNILETDTKRDVVFEEKNGTSLPITEKVLMPKVEGAIVTAEGAGNVLVKTNIIQAVSAVTGLSTYKVQVFEMKE